jgi:hypothetical protein
MEALLEPMRVHGSNSVAVPYFIGNPRMCQQKLSRVITLSSAEYSSDDSITSQWSHNLVIPLRV